MTALQIGWRKLSSIVPIAVLSLAVMGIILPQAAEAAFTTVSNEYLINDYLFDGYNLTQGDGTTPLLVQQAGSKGGEPTEVYRYTKKVDPNVNVSTTSFYSPIPAAGQNSSFIAPVNLLSNELSVLPSFDASSATLDNIYADWSPDYEPIFPGSTETRVDVYLYFYNNTVGNLWSTNENPSANQDLRAWYEITLETVGGTYVATSDSGKLFDPEGATNNDNAREFVTNWNNIAWSPSDPFAGGGIPYADITDVSVEFFYTNVVPWLASDLPLSFTINEAPIFYTTTFDLQDTVAPAAPPAVAAELYWPGGIQVTWSNSPDADVSSYIVYRTVTPGSNYTAVATNAATVGLTEFSYLNYSLNRETTYYYYVTAKDVAGNESVPSAEVSATTATDGAAGSIVSLNFVLFTGATNETIEGSETFGIASLGTVVSNWDNRAISDGSGIHLLTDSGLRSSVSYTRQGNASAYYYEGVATNTPLHTGTRAYAYEGARNVTFNNLNAPINFPDGYYAIVYLVGFDSGLTNSITDGTTTNYWGVDYPYTGTLNQSSSTSSSLYDQGHYVVFGSAEAPLTNDTLKLTYQAWSTPGSAGIGGVQLVAAPKVPYNIWAGDYGMDPDLFPGRKTDDWDGEGTENWVEFALNGNPTNDLDNGYIANGLTVDGGTYLDLVYHRAIDPGTVTYTVESSSDLAGGFSPGGTIELPAGSLNDDYEIVTNRLDTAAAEAGFINLKLGDE